MRDIRRTYSGNFRLYLFDTFVGNAMLPVFNIFLPILAISIGADALQVGLVGGASNALYAFMPFVMGRFSDRRETRKFFVLSGLLILTLVSLLYAVASNPIMLIALRVVEGTAWSMFWPSIEAEMTLDNLRDPRKSLSVFNVAWSGASALGPIIGSLATLLLSLHAAFFVTAGILLSTLALNLFHISRRRSSSAEEERRVNPLNQTTDPKPQPSEERDVREAKRKRAVQLKFVLASNALVGVSFSVLITFYGPYAQSVGISIAMIGAVTFFYGFLRFFFFYLTTRDSFRSTVLESGRRNKVVLVATAITCLSTLLFLTNIPTLAVSLIVFSLVGISQTFVILISQVATIAEARVERKGARAGLLESTLGMGATLGPIVGGTLSGQSLVNSFFVPGISFVGVMIVLSSYIGVRRLTHA